MRRFFATVLITAGLCGAAARAAEAPYTAAAFEATLAARRPAAVVFHADWCPTCRAQAPVLKRLSESPEFASLTLYVADFDSEQALRRSLKVGSQSTVVVFRDGHEVTRATGVTEREPLAALLRAAGAAAPAR